MTVVLYALYGALFAWLMSYAICMALSLLFDLDLQDGFGPLLMIIEIIVCGAASAWCNTMDWGILFALLVVISHLVVLLLMVFLSIACLAEKAVDKLTLEAFFHSPDHVVTFLYRLFSRVWRCT